MKPIIYGRLDKKLILVLFLEIIRLINIIISKKSKEDKTNPNKILTSLEEEFGSIILGIILFFKFKNRQKRKHTWLKSILYFLILFVIKLAEECYHYIFNYNEATKYNFYKCDFSVNGLELILVTVGTLFSLKYKYYKHHIITMILYTLLGISIDLILEKFNKDYPYSYIYIAYVFVYIGKYCYLKYMMDKLYYTYIEILIFLGSIGFIQKIFIFTGLSLYENKNNTDNGDYKNIFRDISNYFCTTHPAIILFYQILYFLIIGAIERLLVILILYYLRPNHMIMADNIYLFVFLLFNLTKKERELFSIIPFCFQIFALLFYYEILELNFCGLNKNTIKNIQSREEIEDNEGNDNLRETFNSQIELSEDYFLTNRATKNINIIIDEELIDPSNNNNNELYIYETKNTING